MHPVSRRRPLLPFARFKLEVKVVVILAPLARIAVWIAQGFVVITLFIVNLLLLARLACYSSFLLALLLFRGEFVGVE